MSTYDAAMIKKQIIGGAVSALTAYATATHFGIDPVVAAIAVTTYKIAGIILSPILHNMVAHRFPNMHSKDAKERSSDLSGFLFANGLSALITNSGLAKASQYVAGRLGKNILFSQAYMIGPVYCMAIGNPAEYLASYYIY